MYRLIRSLLFLLPAEKAHYFSMNFLKVLCFIGFIRNKLSNHFNFYDSQLATNVFGLTFKNPVGLGAGFDKNAKYLRELETLGFGFVEIGTVTPKPQAGNEKPRLFRLPKDKALINRMGFNNEGVEVIAERLKIWRRRVDRSQLTEDSRKSTNQKSEIRNKKLVIGGNIGKNKTTTNEDAWKDYAICFNTLHPYVDFFVVNVSSPNTPGLRELQEKSSLKKILTHLQMLSKSYKEQKPILLKIAPDLSQQELDEVIDLADEVKLDGLVVTNTTISREQLATGKEQIENIGAGGLSGKPLALRSTEMLLYINKKTQGRLPLIASGGIFNGNDTLEKLKAGAVLFEVWTGFIYEGPSIVKNICNALKN